MKCYVLTLAKTYPKKHPKGGKETGFAMKILTDIKLHTIRLNYELWRKRFEKIDAGDAYISVREWSGAPYRSPQKELYRFDNTHDIGLEAVIYDPNKDRLRVIDFDNYTYGENLGAMKGVLVGTTEIAHNDGLLPQDFNDWFGGIESLKKFGAVIHFTKFRYDKE